MKLSISIGIPNRNPNNSGTIPGPEVSLYELEGSTFVYMLEAGGLYRTEKNYAPVVDYFYLLEDLSGTYEVENGGGSYLNET